MEITTKNQQYTKRKRDTIAELAAIHRKFDKKLKKKTKSIERRIEILLRRNQRNVVPLNVLHNFQANLFDSPSKFSSTHRSSVKLEFRRFLFESPSPSTAVNNHQVFPFESPLEVDYSSMWMENLDVLGFQNDGMDFGVVRMESIAIGN